MAKVFSIIAFFLSTAAIMAQSHIIHGTVDLDETEMYYVKVYELAPDTAGHRWHLIHTSRERGQYTFEIESKARAFTIVYRDQRGREKICYVIEPPRQEGRIHVDVNFSEETAQVHYSTDVRSMSMQTRVIKTKH